MLHRYSEIFRTLVVIVDLLLIAGAWMGAYWARFHMGLPAPRGVPDVSLYVPPLLVLLPTWLVIARSQRLYSPQRTESLGREAGLILRSTAMMVVGVMAVSFAIRDVSYSRGVVVAFSLAAPILLVGLRLVVRGSLRAARRRGYNQRHVLLVGAGRLAEEIVERIHAHPEAGLRVFGTVADGPPGPRRDLHGVPVLGTYGALKTILREHSIDQVIVALPREEWSQVEKVLADLDDEVVSIRLAPDLLHIATLRSSVENLDGLPIINLRESPMLGWAAVQKRCFDLVVGCAALVLLSPLFAAVAFGVGLSSGRPILYSQRRVGLDGREFQILKFRSMRRDAEADSGPVRTRLADPRRTRFGRFLRRFSLDELPQLINVVRGEMSIVGPRPERPVFIQEFRSEIPGYMLRLKVKAGMTGWAQIHGWRGDTSLQERVEHDIYYIQNWSISLDLWITLRTVWSTLFDRNAY